MMRRRSGFAAIAAFLVVGLALLHAGKSFAQSTIALLPPTVSAVDRNGVDLVNGNLTLGLPSISAGSSGSGISRTGSGYNLPYGDNFNGALNGGSDSTGSYMLVSLGSQSEKFYGPASVTSGTATVTYTPEIVGDTFSCVSYICTYTLADGTTAVFDQHYDSTVGIASRYGAITSLTKPDGEVLRFYYMFHPNVGTIPGYGQVDILGLRAVTSSLGWMVRYDTSTPGSSVSPSKIYIINTSVDYCDPTSDTPCTAADSATWPTMTIGSVSGHPTYTINGDTTTLYVGSYGSPVSQQFATGETSPTGVAVASTYTGATINTVTVGGQAWTYAYSTSGAVKTSTVTDPNSHVARVITSDTATGHILSDQNATGQVTKYTYYTTTGSGALKGKVWQVIAPDATYSGATLTGGYTQYEYDARGNVTRITTVPKNGGTPMIQSATYPCTVAKACNKPATVTDVNGVVTTYTYDPSSGEVATMTLPPPSTGGIAPQVRYTYAQITPHHYEVPGHYGALTADAPVWRLVSTSTCMTTSSCSGSADEARTTVSYGSDNANPTYKNVLPVSVTKQIGNANLGAAASGTNVWQTTTYTYDSNGNVLTTNPKPGTVATTYNFYDNQNRIIGTIGVDPDGAGSRPRPASKTIYNADGKVAEIDTGTVTGTTAAALSAMTIVARDTNEFSTSTGLPVVARHYIGTSSTAKDVTQRSYDNLQRVDCEAIRLNSTDYASLPASACTLGTTTAEGLHDRITKYNYDAAGRVLSTISGYGTGTTITDVTKTYDASGATASSTLSYVEDAKGNRTSYSYDGFDRVIKTCYPLTASAHASSTTDCARMDYRPTTVTGASQMTSLVNGVYLRDNTTGTPSISYAYDGLGRAYSSSGGVTESVTYDNFGQVKTHTNNGQTETYTYNAAGWLLSDAQALGTVSYTYDGYGKRTQMTYPGSGLYVTYAYDDGDELTGIYENGATQIASFGYDNYGRRTSLGRGSGYATSSGFDTSLRLQTLAFTAPGSSGNSVTLGYNSADQIASRQNSNTGFDAPSPGLSVTTFGVNGLNQMTSFGGATITFDTRGNMSSDGGSESYGYNASNLLTSASGTVSAALSYDAENRLQTYTAAGVTTKFLYDGADLIAEYDSSGTLLRRYVHGPGDDEPLVWYEGSGTATKRYFAADERGSIIGVTDSSGNVLSVYSYDAWGVPHVNSGSLTSRFAYTGQVWLPELSLYDYKARMYAPTMGHFLQTDPIGYGDGMNWYAYVHSDPINGRDPSGLDCNNNYSPGRDAAGITVVIACVQRPSLSPYDEFENAGGACAYDILQCDGGQFYYDRIGSIGIPQRAYAPPSDAPTICHINKIEVYKHDNYLNISGNISFPDGESSYRDAIDNAWTGTFGSYTVHTGLTLGPGGLVAHISYGVAGRPDADLGGPNLHLNNLTGSTPSQSAYSLWAAGHEFGHSLGLIDQYDYSTFKPFPGHENEIMGAVNGTPNEGTINSVLSNCK